MNQDSAAFLNAIRGPVILITVGVLFALDNFTPFGFSRTWPVLLVVTGILSLGKNVVRPKRPAMPLPNNAQWGPPRPPTPPPAPPAMDSTPPGTYRGSNYEATPGSSTLHGQEVRDPENREKRERPAAATADEKADTGATQ
jgi:hypothetical protein